MKRKLPLSEAEENWLFAAKEIEKQRAPEGQSCGSCAHCARWKYTRITIFYCKISRSNRTANGMAKTKARAWCSLWKKEGGANG